MRTKYNYLSGEELAEALPKIKMLHDKGVSTRDIAELYGLGVSTVHGYVLDYNTYLHGGSFRHISRAIPYLIVQQAKLKFTEEQGRLPEQRGSYTKPSDLEVKRREITLLWGRVKIRL